MKHLLILLLITSEFALPSPSIAREVQSHGLLFERWLCSTFFGGYEPKGYTQKWDIPAESNPDHGRIPVNPKAAKYGASIGLGDALRQYEIKEPFLLIVGFWKQVTPEEKHWIHVQAVTVESDAWAGLWRPIARVDLEKLTAVIKDQSLSLEEARRRAQAIKSQPPFTEAVIQVNPKIDASQRRLQCSLRFEDFFRHLSPESSTAPQSNPQVFGVPVPAQFESAPRKTSPP